MYPAQLSEHSKPKGVDLSAALTVPIIFLLFKIWSIFLRMYRLFRLIQWVKTKAAKQYQGWTVPIETVWVEGREPKQ